MGKAKEKQSSTSKTTPKCGCLDPYTCTCGNRPVRPSKGHKWYPDEQLWGGKGHKQKGGSGQVSSVSTSAIITTKGQTKVEQWQRLPSQLLDEYCKKQKRPLPVFQNVENKSKSTEGKAINDSSLYRVRVKLADVKEKEKDLYFLPSRGIRNEEQATEESCLLALIHLTPNIPHERKLPEPYRTTWLNNTSTSTNAATIPTTKADFQTTQNVGAIQNIDNDNGTKKNNNRTKDDSAVACAAAPSTVAQASTKLKSATSFVNNATKRQQEEAHRQQRNARIRYHEAVRMANQNHAVFMSAQIRRQIEALLRGDNFDGSNVSNDNEENENDAAEDESDVQTYVQERLRSEGFLIRQARTAFKECLNSSSTKIDEDQWESVYEKCLQWLLINLNEEHLPEGFDPRGTTLDVIVPSVTSRSEKQVNQTYLVESKGIDNNVHNVLHGTGGESASTFAKKYGITMQEALLISSRARDAQTSMTHQLWSMLSLVADGSTVLNAQSQATNTNSNTNHNFISNEDLDDSNIKNEQLHDLLKEEIETLEAIYGTDCIITVDNTTTTVILPLMADSLFLEVIVPNTSYPDVLPVQCLIYGVWETDNIGTYFNVEAIKFVRDQSLGEPLIFSLHSFVQDQLSTTGETNKFISLLPNLDPVPSAGIEPLDACASMPVCSKDRLTLTATVSAERTTRKRPKGDRKTFWNILPHDTPPASVSPDSSATIRRARLSLPAAASRSAFLAAVNHIDQSSSRVVLVTGETGSGKSTQLPAFLLESDPVNHKIVVAQPRRIAATGVAARVAEERGEDRPGVDSVGYVVRGDSAISVRSRLVFCTTGVLLRQLQQSNVLECITHIVVDEVHERNLDSDVLLGLLKQYLGLYPHLRVILMSANLETNRFTEYFAGSTPHIHIPGRTFPVTDFTLEDVLSMTKYVPPRSKRIGHSTSSITTSIGIMDDEKTDDGDMENTDLETSQKLSHVTPHDDLLKHIDESVIDYALIAQLVKYIISTRPCTDKGSILIFLPGVQEIQNSLQSIKRSIQGQDILVEIIQLHGGLLPKEQSKIFSKVPVGCTKVILSTNVAETSITIPDCTIVIDTAREKQACYDPSNRMPMLVEQFASMASLQQRRGRAGRVQKGVCYKLVSKKTLAKLKHHSEPEIRRVALDQTLLQLLFLGLEDGKGSFFNTLLDPPLMAAMDSAVSSLRSLGAVTNIPQQDKAILTPLGEHLAGIPEPPIIGKLLVMGSILGCRESALSIAATLSIGRTPLLPLRNWGPKASVEKGNVDNEIEQLRRQLVLGRRKTLAKSVGNSDHAFLACLMLKWKSSTSNKMDFCNEIGLSNDTMRDISLHMNQLESALTSSGFLRSSESSCNNNNWRIVHACAVAAMAPGQVVRVQRPVAKYTETSEGSVIKDGESRDLKFFIRAILNENNKSIEEKRVFIHPASMNMSTGTYNCPYLVYNSLVTTSKPFLRDVTECSAYALLLFGGPMEVRASDGLIVLDNWIQLAANARIGSLIGGLRKNVDNLLRLKTSTPSLDIYSTAEMRLIVKLISTDGLGT